MKREESIWYEDFALERGYDPDQLVIWSKENERFSGVYKFSKSWQRSRLVNGGLLNKFNSNITKLVLANTSGWKDMQTQQINATTTNTTTSWVHDISGVTKDLVQENNGSSQD